MSDCENANRPEIDVRDEADLAALITLAGLPGLSPPRFWSLLALGAPTSVLARVRSDRLPMAARPRGGGGTWSSWASQAEPARVLAAHRDAGVDVLPFGTTSYPMRLRDDPDPPAVLFAAGPNTTSDDVAVAIVGTRKCSRYGTDVARELAAVLAGRSVTVVSGLAHGIDAAAHAGASRIDPSRCAAVVASGLDVVYPVRNRSLWNSVAQTGRLYSEWPLGAPSHPWRFPARNRIVAALSVAVVVIESGLRGGSMYTVDEAVLRDRPVFAVPGPIRSEASAGTNRLIADGAQILCSIEALADTLAPLPSSAERGVNQGQLELAPAAAPERESWLLELLGWEPMVLDSIVAESGRSPVDVMLAIERALAAGHIARQGARIERVR